MSAAQVNHMAKASTSTATSLKKVRTGYSSLDEPGSLHAAGRGWKRRVPSGRRLLCCAGSNQFGGPAGDRGIVAEAVKPQHIRLAAKPRHLPLCIVAMSLLRCCNGLLAGKLPAKKLNRLLVAKGIQRRGSLKPIE